MKQKNIGAPINQDEINLYLKDIRKIKVMTPDREKELGDLMLHIVFYSKIGSEKKEFTLEEVINGVCEKLVARHPHIYGDVKVQNEDEVKQNWEKLK